MSYWHMHNLEDKTMIRQKGKGTAKKLILRIKGGCFGNP